MEDQLTLDHCIGKANFYDSHKTNWYGFGNICINNDARCEYCYRHKQIMNTHHSMYLLGSTPEIIECGTIFDPSLSMIESNGFRFQVLSHDMKKPFLVYPLLEHKRADGLLYLELPKKTRFVVHIDPRQGLKQKDVYFSFKMKIREKEVVLNEGKKSYYHDQVTVHGYNSTEFFEFKYEPVIKSGTMENNTLSPYEYEVLTLIQIDVTVYRKSNNVFIKLSEIPIKIYLGFIYPTRYMSFVNSIRHQETADSS